jgi:hypothetical protein
VLCRMLHQFYNLRHGALAVALRRSDAQHA